MGGAKGIKEHRMPVWRKIRRGPYLYLLGIVACLAAVFGIREWGQELGLAVLLLLIMLYMAKDIFGKR